MDNPKLTRSAQSIELNSKIDISDINTAFISAGKLAKYINAKAKNPDSIKE